MDNQELIELVGTVIKREISPIIVRLDAMDQRFDAMDQRFDAMDQRFDAMDQRFDSIENRLGVLEIKQDTTQRKLDNLDFKVDNLAISMKGSERNIKKDIRLLQDGQETLIAVLEAKGILPRVELQ